MGINDFLSLARVRRTVRKYDRKPVSREQVEMIIEAGIWAPSGFNMQPWHFVMVDDQVVKARLIKAITDEVIRAQKSNPSFQGHVPAYLAEVPLFIVVIGDPTMKQKLPPHRLGATAEKIYLSSVSAAMQNMHLAAAAMGLGTVWFTVDSGSETQADWKSILNIPGELEVLYVIPVGCPADPLTEPDHGLRKPTAAVISWNTFRWDRLVINPRIRC